MGSSQYIQGKTGFFIPGGNPLYFSPIAAFWQPIHGLDSLWIIHFLRIFKAR